MEKCFNSSFLGILFSLKPDRLLAEIVCDILFVFEIHSITKLTPGIHSKDFEILDACSYCVILSTGNRKWKLCTDVEM